MNLKKIQFSSNYLWGYRIEIDLNDINTIKELIEICIKKYINFLKINNLLELYDLLKNTKDEYHIHDFSSIEEIKNSEDPIIYLCNHK